MRPTLRTLAALLPACLTLAPAKPLPAQSHAATAIDAAVVTIHTTTHGGNGYMGSGALISPSGRVLTCYHVIVDATSIDVILQGNDAGISTVSVEEISPETDLAVLQLVGVKRPLPYLPIATQAPTHLLGRQLRVYGYLEGLHRQVLQPTATQDEPASVMSFRDSNGVPIFRNQTPQQNGPGGSSQTEAIHVIPLVMPASYKGLSGGPLVAKEGIIGIYSGAINEGGTLAWAIPVSLLHSRSMKKVGVAPQAVSWQPLTLLSDMLKYMRAELGPAEGTMDTARQYIRSLDQTRVAFETVRERIRAYNANTTDVIDALGQIPAESQGRRSSEIAKDPNLRALNARIAALFHTGDELESRWIQAGDRLVQSATQADNNLHALARASLQTFNTLSPSDRNGALMISIAGEFSTTLERIQQHPLPEIKHPDVVIGAADSVSVAQLRAYLTQTRGNLEDMLSTESSREVEEFLAAYESAALPLERVLEINSH